MFFYVLHVSLKIIFFDSYYVSDYAKKSNFVFILSGTMIVLILCHQKYQNVERPTKNPKKLVNCLMKIAEKSTKSKH